MEEAKILKVKHDLREIRKMNRSVEAAIRTRDKHLHMIETLRSMNASEFDGGEEAKKKTIADLESVVCNLRIDISIKRMSELEAKYLAVIGTLDRIDQEIVIDGYINGKAYWKIGRDIGYTEDGIKKRIRKIAEVIASRI